MLTALPSRQPPAAGTLAAALPPVHLKRTGGEEVTLPAISHLLNWQSHQPALVLLSGFHNKSPRSVWSLAESSLILTRGMELFLTCNYLRPGESRTVEIECDGARRSIVIDDSYACYPVNLGSEHPSLVKFTADGAIVPLTVGLNSDARSLSFEIWFTLPEHLYVANVAHSAQTSLLPTIYCVYYTKKEEDTLRPLYEGLLAKGWPTALLDVQGTLERAKGAGDLTSMVCLISSASAYSVLFNAGARGHFMYAEHGASPLKVYTYHKHYQRYDLILLPGDLWVDRLNKLYPHLQTKCRTVGYAKVRVNAALSEGDRSQRCAKLGLDPDKKLVLFAPSWSGDDRSRGIFNVTNFDKSNALLTIPHDGDYAFAQEMRDAGYLVHTLDGGEVISDYYDLVDVLVSDVSSTAVEFAASGKPVLCISIERIPDFDASFRESETKIRVPHTDRYWDFCPVVPASQVNTAVAALLEHGFDEGAALLRKCAVKDFLDCVGVESAERSVQAIDSFVRETVLHV